MKMEEMRSMLIPNGDQIEVPNPETGEMEIYYSADSVIPYLANGRDHFFIVYASFVGAMINGLSLAEIKVFAYLLSNYNSGTSIGIIKAIKNEMVKKTGLSMGTINNTLLSLTKIKEHPILFKAGKATYILNPRFAYKGSTRDRDKELKAMFKIGCKEC